MSTLAYASLTTRRDDAPPNTSMSASGSPPGVKTYVDAFAALVPSEVLALHALIVSATTQVKDNVTTITAPETLAWAFVGLLVLSIGLYAGARLLTHKWDKYDWVRIAIPPLAFMGWTMLQRATAFDAIYPGMSDASRTVIALFLAVVLGFFATALAYKADQKQP